MIKVCYPQGCYGHYLGQCLYYFTNLDFNKSGNFAIDHNGSSHAFRSNLTAKKYVQIGHPTDNLFKILPEDDVIVIQPDPEHWLDYYNNYCTKEYQEKLIQAIIDGGFSIEEISHKLKSHWNYSGVLDDSLPNWILREFISFFIGDKLYHTYEKNQCKIDNAIATISTQVFFVDFLHHFKNLCKKLNLTTVDDKIITLHNQAFVSAQRYHGSQLACNQWVHSIINNTIALSPAQTIIDEAYIQYYLRQQGYEIFCNGLEIFPKHSQEMAKLIYKINSVY